MVVEVSGLGKGSHALCRNSAEIAMEFISHFKAFSAISDLTKPTDAIVNSVDLTLQTI